MVRPGSGSTSAPPKWEKLSVDGRVGVVGAGLDGDGWVLTGCDAEGADLRLGGRTARLSFDETVRDAEGARVQLVRLVKRARERAAG